MGLVWSSPSTHAEVRTLYSGKTPPPKKNRCE
uniref:Uncharacterized protein n=1 Tax=Anguilla anguilla TaxID=7936 RepID=A0A0E9UMQ7_ANGAN